MFSRISPRRMSQLFFISLTLFIGWRFALWATALEQGRLPSVTRPPSVDAFLPLSGLMNLKYTLGTGTIHGAHPAALLLFLAVCASALLVKKGFCSFVCPVGFAGEMAGRLGNMAKLARPLPRFLDIPLRGIKYMLLGFFLWNILVNMPVPAIRGFLSNSYNLTADIRMFRFFTEPSTGSLITLGLLLGLPVLIKNGWCRYLCPYGALLGLLSFFSILKIHRNDQACTHCGRCAKACPSSLAVDKKRTMVSDECTGCLTCVESCPEKEALRLSTSPTGAAWSPRTVALLMVMLFLLTAGAGRLSGNWKSHTSNRTIMMEVMKMKKMMPPAAR
ncbi:4Fe-4S binding protein [Desulfoluna spongiiphila]|uniref:4Fe-4S binding domain-containing protein n=1 Tax=Desulfoluna spongiiphila TaxID=419481 RepID=A0A1G5CXM8_9BACT|nr:4Fe-4S binding protein [Desulfoluna spongiiphila]SCY07319.1 4Fe-4S binding domain-containing protein [Desulfoluna spongiiphila]